MGNVLRTAEALGVRHLALVGACCDLYSPKVLRGSMGAVFRLGVRWFEDAEACLAALNAEGVTSLAAVPDSTAVPITTIPFETGNWAVWIGNEGNGLTKEAIERCKRTRDDPDARPRGVVQCVDRGGDRALGDGARRKRR